MTRTQFEELVQRLESVGAEQKRSYRLKVGLLAMAGYAYILAVLAVLLALLTFLVFLLPKGRAAAVKLIIPVGALALTVLRALWVRWPEPEGIQISKAEAPKLFGEVEAIRVKVGAPKVHRVFLNDAYNAALEQRPRLGILGWPEGILHLGLPLMHALSPTEFRAVLAHEMGHLSGNHGHISGWVYRLRTTWSRLLYQLEQEGRWGSGIFTRFLNWYAPFLNAYSFVLARAQEYEADRCAADVVGKDAAARMLVALNVRGKFLEEEFWPGLWKAAGDQAVPPNDTYAQQATAFSQFSPGPATRRWVAQSLSAKTDYVDTHPSLQDRLAALGAPVSVGQWSLQVERPGNPTAAESMLGANAEAWYRRLNKEWSSAVQESWKDHHNEIQEQKKRLAELRSNGTPESLNDQDSWEFASLVCRIDGDEVALPLLQRIVYRNPKHVSANFTLGRILLERGNADGVARLAEAMRGDPECTLNACYLIEQFHRENRNPDEAERFRQRALEYSELSVEAEKERNNITAQDAFSPHDLDDEFVVELQAHLKRYDRLAAAYLVRKEVRIWPERPAFVLGLVANSSWFRSQNDADVTMFNQIVQNAPLPAGTYVILLDSSRKTLRKEMESVAGSRV